MDCNVASLGKTFLILIAMPKNPVLLQKVLKDLFRLSGRQELFPGQGSINTNIPKGTLNGPKISENDLQSSTPSKIHSPTPLDIFDKIP